MKIIWILFLSAVLFIIVTVSGYYYVKKQSQKENLQKFINFCTIPRQCIIRDYRCEDIENIEIDEENSRNLWKSLEKNIKTGITKYYPEDAFQSMYDFEVTTEDSKQSWSIRFIDVEVRERGVVMYKIKSLEDGGTIILDKQSATNIKNTFLTYFESQ